MNTPTTKRAMVKAGRKAALAQGVKQRQAKRASRLARELNRLRTVIVRRLETPAEMVGIEEALAGVGVGGAA